MTKDALEQYRRAGESREGTLARLSELVAQEDAAAFSATIEHADGRDVLAQAESIFGGTLQAEQWMTTPAIGLGGRLPIELLSTIAGKQMVTDFLTRLEYSVYS